MAFIMWGSGSDNTVTALILGLIILAVGCDEQPSASMRPVKDLGKPAVKVPDPVPPPPAPPIMVERVGFKEPESVLHDPQADLYLVSNIVGKALDKDGQGFISKLSPKGKLLKLRWIEGGRDGVELNAPKGMAIVGDLLYVADIDVLRVFERETGKPERAIKVKGATFLNSVTVGPNRNIYVSDSALEQWGPYMDPTGKDAIYRIKGDKKLDMLIQDKRLGSPNGITASAAGLWVVNKVGELHVIDYDGNKRSVEKLPKGTLGGVVALPGGQIWVSSWDAKAVFERKPDGKFVPLLKKITSPADIGYDAKRKRLLIPQLTEDRVRIQPL